MLSGDESYFSTLSTITVLENGTVTQDLGKVTDQRLGSKNQLLGNIEYIPGTMSITGSIKKGNKILNNTKRLPDFTM